MDIKRVGALLQDAHPIPDTSVESVLSSDDTNPQILAKESSLASPEVMLTFPKYYLTREKQRVTMYGVIDAETVEHADGFRFFDSDSFMFRENGMVRLDGEDPSDLGRAVSQDDDHELATGEPEEKWVHPQHRLLNAFFRPINTEEGLIKDRHYLNRMGFVVHIVRIQNAAYDDGGRQYLLSGARYDHTVSMTDLVTEILNWPEFETSDWTSTTVLVRERPHIASEDEIDFLDNFDPNRGSETLLTAELFKKVLECKALAKRLNISFGFHMNVDPGGSS